MPDRSTAATATILFTDLVGSTALRARLGEERADELRRVHDALLCAAAADHAGQVVKSTGDGLMVAFTSATDALSCAVEMQRCVAAYTARRDAIAAVSIRVGLSTGDVGWDDGDCFGTPVIEAARLEAAAAGTSSGCSVSSS